MTTDLKEIDGYCETVAEYFKTNLGSALAEVYKLGSLAHGGFSHTYSDIDMCLLMACQEAPAEMARLIADAKDLNPTHGKKLSVFWGNPTHSWGRLPVLDRVDLLDHGVPLFSARRPDFPRPDKESIHAALVESVQGSWKRNTDELSVLSELPPEKRKPFVRCILYPARLIYSWDHLAITSNDRAVEYLHAVEPPGLDLHPIQLALECRHGSRDVDRIFAHRVDLTAQFTSAIAYLGNT